MQLVTNVFFRIQTNIACSLYFKYPRVDGKNTFCSFLHMARRIQAKGRENFVDIHPFMYSTCIHSSIGGYPPTQTSIYYVHFYNRTNCLHRMLSKNWPLPPMVCVCVCCQLLQSFIPQAFFITPCARLASSPSMSIYQLAFLTPGRFPAKALTRKLYCTLSAIVLPLRSPQSTISTNTSLLFI